MSARKSVSVVFLFTLVLVGAHAFAAQPGQTLLDLNRNLRIGTRGSDVASLQDFLRSTGDFTYPTSTGYFGSATAEAVQRYQSRNNIVNGGTPETTGYGAVGPKTREIIKGGAQTTPPASSPSPKTTSTPSTSSGKTTPPSTSSSGFTAPREPLIKDAIKRGFSPRIPAKFRSPAPSVSASQPRDTTPYRAPTSAPPSNSASCVSNKADLVPLYGVFNARTGQGLYTTSESEKKDYIFRLGYHDRGVAGYIYSKPLTGTIPLQRFKKNTSDDRFYDVNPNTAELNAAGYYFEKIEGYMSETKGDRSAPLEKFRNSADGRYSYNMEDVRWLLEYWGFIYEGSEGYGCKGAPFISDNTILAFANSTFVIQGSGFSNITGYNTSYNPKRADYKVTLRSGGNSVVIDSNSPQVVSWSGGEIKIKTPPGINSSYRVSVTAGEYGQSNEVPMRVYEHYAYPSVGPGNVYGSYPLDIAMDNSGKIWVMSEFSRGIDSFDPISKINTYYKDVQPENLIFIWKSTTPVDFTTFGEDVDIDVNGDIWYTQGGEGFGQLGAARIVQLTPSTGKQRCYNVPAVGPAIIGILLDSKTGTVWAGAENIVVDKHPNFLMSFKPSTFSDKDASCTYDFIAPYPVNFCSDNETIRCFKKYDLIYKETPTSWGGYGAAHLEKGPDGNIWFTDFYATSIGMFDIATQKITIFPMPASPIIGGLGSGPWQIKADSLGNIWINEYFESQFIKFDTRAKDRLNCTEVDSSGRNPCATEYDVLYFPISDRLADQVHSIDIDSSNRVWFSAGGAPDTSVGFIGMIDTAGELDMFPPLTDIGVKGGAMAGLLVDKKTGDIWFYEFWNKKIIHLKYVK